MVEIDGFHATTNKSCDNIFKIKHFNYSQGDRHWLGDGIYFYIDDFFAYRWCVLECKKIIKTKLNAKCITDNYSIIKIGISVDSDRIFDLDNIQIKFFFLEAYKLIRDSKDYIPRLKSVEMAEGVVLNYLFNEMNYGKDYDIIHASFGGSKQVQLRHGTIEKQICIRNDSVIKNMRKFNYTINISKYNQYWEYIYPEDDSRKKWYYPKYWA